MPRAVARITGQTVDTAMLIVVTKMAQFFFRLKTKVVAILLTVVAVIRIMSCRRYAAVTTRRAIVIVW
jgi:hypothetical protein